MNLKDRLESIRKTDVVSIKEDYEHKFLFDIEDVFADSQELKTIITETISSGKNILFVSEPSIDKNLVSKYFSYLLSHRLDDVIVSEYITDEILSSESRINIIPKPSVKEIVKILEYIMYGYKTFVFGMSFATLDNVLNKIKAAISINCRGLSPETIETILSSANLVIVYLNKNVDGLFYISKIDKVVCENLMTDIVTVIDFQQQKPILKKNKKIKKTLKDKETIVPENTISEVSENSELELPNEETFVEEIGKDIVILEENVVEQSSEVIENPKVVEENEVLASSELDISEMPVSSENVQEEMSVEFEQNVQIEKEEVTSEYKDVEIHQEQQEIISEISKKINKYKLLKEKAKIKKVDI